MAMMYDLVPHGWRLLNYGEIIQEGDYWMDYETAFKVTEELIRKTAHQIWERNGRQDGKDLENWNLAEMELINIFCFPEKEMVGQVFFCDNGLRTIRRVKPMSFTPKLSAKQRVQAYLKKCDKTIVLAS